MIYVKRGEKHPAKKAMFFDKEKITVVRQGQTINCYDAIQEANEDTDIYETFEKYGNVKACGERKESVFADLTKQPELREALDILDAGKKDWGRLDAKTKAEYNNSPELFAKDALDNVNNFIIAEEKRIKAEKELAEKIKENINNVK